MGNNFIKYFTIILLGLLLITPTEAKDPPSIFDLIRQAEKEYHLPKGLLSAMTFVESKYNVLAYVKHDGKTNHSSHGLMQIQLPAAREVGFKGTSKELMDPRTNIKYAAKYLKMLLNKTNNNYAAAISAYNSGLNSRHQLTYTDRVLNALMTGK